MVLKPIPGAPLGARVPDFPGAKPEQPPILAKVVITTPDAPQDAAPKPVPLSANTEYEDGLCERIERLEHEQKDLRSKRTLGQFGANRLLTIERLLSEANLALTSRHRWAAWEKEVQAAIPGLEPLEAKWVAMYAPIEGGWRDGAGASWAIDMAFEDPSPVLPRTLKLLPEAEAAMRSAAQKIRQWTPDRCIAVAAFIRGTRLGKAPR